MDLDGIRLKYHQNEMTARFHDTISIIMLEQAWE